MKKIVSNEEPRPETPNNTWETEKLTAYVRECFKTREEMCDHYKMIGRKSTVELYRAGHGLALIRDKLKADQAYEQWLTDNKIAKGTANEAIRLYYKAKRLWKDDAENQIGQMTITEAKVKFGIIKEKAKPKTGLPTKPKDDVAEKAVQQSAEPLPSLDSMLFVIAERLERASKWDRTDMDASRLDELARKCIEYLERFLINETLPIEKKASKKSPQKKGGSNDAA